MTNVLWYLKRRLCYDQVLINDVFSGPEFEHTEFSRGQDYTATPDFGAIVVLPGRQCVEPPENDVPMLKAMLQRMKWAVVLITGDEESRFPFQELMMPHTRVWVMSPVQGKHDVLQGRHLINGSQPHLQVSLAQYQGQVVTALNAQKDLDWSFAGQITHPRREQCARVLRGLPRGKLIETAGFLQGVSPTDYYALLRRTRVVPCPSGPVELSTARIFEAIECGCIPVVDNKTPYPEYANAAKPGYWNWFFGEEVPFPTVNEWSEFPAILSHVLANFESYQGRIYPWWVAYKERFRANVMNDQRQLAKISPF